MALATVCIQATSQECHLQKCCSVAARTSTAATYLPISMVRELLPAHQLLKLAIKAKGVLLLERLAHEVRFPRLETGHAAAAAVAAPGTHVMGPGAWPGLGLKQQRHKY